MPPTSGLWRDVVAVWGIGGHGMSGQTGRKQRDTHPPTQARPVISGAVAPRKQRKLHRIRAFLILGIAISLAAISGSHADDDAPVTIGPPPAKQQRRFHWIRRLIHSYWPVFSSFVFLAAAIALAFALRSNHDDAIQTPNCDSSATSVGTREWQIWIGTVSAGLAIAIVLAIHGIVRLKRIPGHWPPRADVGKVAVWLHGVAALAWIYGLGRAVSELVHDPRTWPLDDMELRLQWVAGIGLLCATPWLAMTWLCHKAVHGYWVEPHTLRTDLQDKDKPTRDMTKTDADIAALQQIWSQIVGIALAFATLVAISLIPTGALRNLWLSQNVDGEDAKKRLGESFTTTDVLLYGAMWALVAASVVIPLVASWRSTAQSVVDAAYPPNATIAADKDAKETRESLESMLNLSSGILRNPLTVLTVATPLVTAALAAFIPELGT